MKEQAYIDAANELGWAVASVKAVAEVESAGEGMLSTGEPKILFERHIFHRFLLKAGKLTQQLLIKYPDLINPRSGGYLGGVAEHKKLAKAVTIDREIALQSASWGKFQIMGFNYRSCGYDDIQSFINDMYSGEAGHLKAFIGFIKHHPRMLKAGRDLNWAGFAREYNGPAYAKNNYDVKLAKAYQKYSQ